MEKGVVFGRDMLGYDVHGGKMYINEEGAEIVKLIFHKFVNEKKGTYTISRELREAGYKTITGNAMWTNTVILKALRNEKYCGDLIQRKTYTPDYLTHAKKYNHGEEDFVVLRNHHEPIISRELWEMAQEELDKKAPSEEIKNKHSNRYPLSGKIVCGCCGHKFVARSKKRKDGSVYKAWRCYNSAQHGTSKIDKAGNHIGCDVKSQIRDEDFMLAIQKVVECLDVNRDTILKGLTDVLKIVFSYEQKQTVDKTAVQNKLTNLRSKQEKLLDLYLSEDLSKEAYREKKALYETEISELESILNGANTEIASYDYNQAINDITEYMTNLLYARERDEIFYKNLVEKIVVHSREDIDVYLNLLPHKWKVVLNSVLSTDDLCGSILSTMSVPKNWHIWKLLAHLLHS